LTEVPGFFSQGETVDELKENIQDACKMMSETGPLDFIPAPQSFTVPGRWKISNHIVSKSSRSDGPDVHSALIFDVWPLISDFR